MGYVYVAEAGKYCKIGISETSVEQRMKNIQTGCPVKIQRVWCSRNIPDALGCEKILHNHFRKHNTSGEWFEISFFQAAEEADKVCRCGEDITRIKQLEAENQQLKEMLKRTYTQDEIVNAIINMLPKKASE